MIKRTLLLVCAITIATASFSQQLTIPAKSLKKISENDLKSTMQILTSDSLAGRATGTDGCIKATNYISDYFKQIGLVPMPSNNGYLQRFDLWQKSYGNPLIVVNSDTLGASDLFVSFGHLPINEFIEKELVFVGDGNDSILNKMDLKDKLVLAVTDGKVQKGDIKGNLQRKGALGSLVYKFNDDSFKRMQERENTRRNTRTISPNKTDFILSETVRILLSEKGLTRITGKSANELMELSKNFDPTNPLSYKISIKLPIYIECIPTYNVVGVLKGSDTTSVPVAVTAHYDHVGVQDDGSVCYGADDNASGVSSVLELAQTFAQNSKKNKRDIYFIACGAEEIGLYGSGYFMKGRKTEDFFANVNIDMIGRHDTITKENYVYILGTDKNPWTHNLHQRANNQTTNLVLDYHYNKSSGFGSFMNRSDHYHFHKLNIPVISFFSGLHNDYHTPRDTMDKIDFPLMAKRVKLIFGTLYLLANEEKNPNPDQ